jgi:NAD(P)-dependent dehydrogenase (short-subunit alcohol dehydrogenase family)
MTGKVVLVTGCSSGFGIEIVTAAARRGWRPVATMRDLDRREALDRALSEAGVEADVLELDVTSPSSVRAAVAEVAERTGGRIDAVVLNAGIGDAGFFEDLSDETVRRIFETNFFGAIDVARAVLPHMRARRSGRIVAVSSIGVFLPYPALGTYVASKRALEGWAESLAVEVKPFGIDIACVEPGGYATSIWEKAAVARHEASPYTPLVDTMEPLMRERIAKTARDPREVGERIAKLLEERHPRLRNPVGPDARFMRVATHLVPFRARVGLLSRITGFNKVKVGADARQPALSAK